MELINKYRPATFDEIIGHIKIIKALKEALVSKSRPSTFLLSGPVGTGKTTIARLIANAIDASIVEIDAASNSGVDATKELVDKAKFRPISGSPCQMLIIDECHCLTKQAWPTLLKLTEEPPEWLSIGLCTTELEKVPVSIRSRSYHIPLKPLKAPEIEELIEVVSQCEEFTINNDVFQGIVQASEGSARTALSILQAGWNCQSREDLSAVISKVVVDSSPEIELCKLLLKGNRSWKQISLILERIEDPETATITICRYLAGSMTNKEEKDAQEIYRMLKSFTDTGQYWDKKVLLYVAVGKILWGTETL